MRCDECKVEPVTPGHFCECCGRKLSLQERKAVEEKRAAENSWGEPAPVLPKAQKGDRLVGIYFTPEPYVDEPGDEPAPVVDPVDVDTHIRGFDAVLPEPTVPVAAHATIDPILEAHSAGHAPVEATPVPQVSAPPPVAPVVEAHVSVDAPPAHVDSDAPAARCESCGGPAEDGDLCSRCQQAFQSLLDAPPAFDPVPVAAPPAPAVVEHHEVVPVVNAIPVRPEVMPVASAIPAEPAPTVIKVRPPAAAVVPAVPVVEVATAPHAAPPPVAASLPKSRPAPAVVAAVASSHQAPNRVRTIGAVIAVLVAVAAIGFPLGKLWLGGQETAAFIRQEQPKPPVEQAVAAPAESAAPPAVAPSATVTTVPAAAPAPATVQAAPAVPAAKVAPVTPKMSPAATNRTTAKVPAKSAKPAGSMRLATPVAAPAPVPAPAPEVAPTAPVAAPEPKPEAPAAPIGPFFETRDVNEAPRIATKVEPQIPEDLRDRPLNEIVIVRVLVTQTGQPHMINLLRRSKAGASLDDAIIAAVKQWTFVPARKRGEAVSCWYHVGVPVNRAN